MNDTEKGKTDYTKLFSYSLTDTRAAFSHARISL